MESLITTPTPASSLSLNMAPSKFALNSPGSGGNHLRQWGNFPQQCSSQLDWNCSSQLFAASPILPSGVVFSSNRLFFWWVQMSHAMVTNKSAIPSFVMSRSIKSRKVPFAASKRLTQLKSLHHTIFTASYSPWKTLWNLRVSITETWRKETEKRKRKTERELKLKNSSRIISLNIFHNTIQRSLPPIFIHFRGER